jgi:sec-independent protein translocase protein TatB
MDFLGVGPLELLVILVLALIVVGPERLPQLARSIGNTVRRLREVSSAVTAEWERELNAASMVEGEDGEPVSLRESLMAVRADLQEVASAPTKMLTDASSEIKSASGETKRALKDAQSDLEHSLVTTQEPKPKAESPEPAIPDPDAAPSSEPTPSEPSSVPESATLSSVSVEDPDSDSGALDDDGDHVDS